MEQAVKDYFARISKMGGRARAKKLSKKERVESARVAAQARWAKQKKDGK
jgi:hypothetical protein